MINMRWRIPGARKNKPSTHDDEDCRLRRRDLFRLMAWTVLTLRPLKSLAMLPGSATVMDVGPRSKMTDTLATFSVFLDTLIPDDGISPSATAAGVLREMQVNMERHRMYLRFIRLGCRWLNVQAGGDFVAMPEADRIRLLQRMSRARSGSLPRRFFDLMRYRAMNSYYRKPVAWKGLAVNRPPQPLGYRDFQGKGNEGR
jgi:hypothetical protein